MEKRNNKDVLGLEGKSGYDGSRDAELLERFQSGDQSAFEELMSLYYKSVLNLIYRFKGCSAREAEDTAQEVFLRLYRALPRFELRAKLFTYIYKVTMNQCFKERKHRAKDIPVKLSIDEPLENASDSPIRRDIVDPGDLPLQSVEYGETYAEVVKALQKIDAEMRAPLILNRFYDMTYEEIAEVMELTPAAVRSRVHRARQNILKHLRKAFGGKEF